MTNGNYALEVLVNGRSVREYEKDGRSFIEGRGNTQYSIRVRNNTFKRVLALVSVDGLGVISGQPASTSDAGYVIQPWSAVEIKGFRESQSSVGSFLFTSRDASYAAGQGVPVNAGVIGVRIIEEVEKPTVNFISPQVKSQIWHASTGALMGTFSGCAGPVGPQGPAGVEGLTPRRIIADDHIGTLCSDSMLSVEFTASVKSAAPDFDLGTTWGRRVKDCVKNVDFERGAIVGQMDIYYASRASLEAMGIQFAEETPVAFPQAFPTYAKPPSGWRG